MKRCSICGEDKSLEDFAKKGKGLQWQCRACQAKYRKAHYEKNRQKYIDKAIVNKEIYKREYYVWLSKQHCVDCGNSDIRVLEQDHLSDKLFSIANKVGTVKLKTLMKELDKCETVCANCHRIRTTTRGDWLKIEYLLASVV